MNDLVSPDAVGEDTKDFDSAYSEESIERDIEELASSMIPEVNPDDPEGQIEATQTEQTPEPAADPSGQQDTTPEAMQAPVHWSADHREMFEGLDPKAQQFLMDRHKAMEADYTQKTQQIAPLRNTVAQWGKYLSDHGVTAEQAFHTFMGKEQMLRYGTNDQKIAVLKELAENYGIQPPDPNAQAPDPRVNALQQQIWQMQNVATMQQQQAAQQAAAQTQASMDAFKSKTTEAGTLAHPFYGEVMNEMIAFANADRMAGKQPTMESLYERACQANPAVRAKLEQAGKADKAKAKRTAGSSISGAGSRPVRKPANRNEDLMFDIEDALATMTAG